MRSVRQPQEGMAGSGQQAVLGGATATARTRSPRGGRKSPRSSSLHGPPGAARQQRASAVAAAAPQQAVPQAFDSAATSATSASRTSSLDGAPAANAAHDAHLSRQHHRQQHEWAPAPPQGAGSAPHPDPTPAPACDPHLLERVANEFAEYRAAQAVETRELRGYIARLEGAVTELAAMIHRGGEERAALMDDVKALRAARRGGSSGGGGGAETPPARGGTPGAAPAPAAAGAARGGSQQPQRAGGVGGDEGAAEPPQPLPARGPAAGPEGQLGALQALHREGGGGGGGGGYVVDETLPCVVITDGGGKLLTDIPMPMKAPWSMPEVMAAVMASGLTPLTKHRLETSMVCLERDGVRTVIDNPKNPSISVSPADRLCVVVLEGSDLSFDTPQPHHHHHQQPAYLRHAQAAQSLPRPGVSLRYPHSPSNRVNTAKVWSRALGRDAPLW